MQPKAGSRSRSGRPKVGVRVIASNPLVRERLIQVLAKSHSISALPSDIPRGRRPGNGPIVLVVSLYSVPAEPVPLLARLTSLRHRFRSARILLVGPQLSFDRLLFVLRHGVCGFVEAARAGEELTAAVQCLSKGQIWVSADSFASSKSAKPSAESSGNAGSAEFTVQQARIVELVRCGLANKQIAAELGIGERTVKFHLQNIFAKLGIHDRHLIPNAFRTTANPAAESEKPAQVRARAASA